MQGRTAAFPSLRDAQFDETAFEAQLMANRTAMMVFYYWILKLKTRLLSGDYVEALAAADKAKALLWISAAHIHLLDYFYYTALTVAALYENGTADEQNRGRETPDGATGTTAASGLKTSTDLRRQARTSVAEIARLEGREARRNASIREAISLGKRERLRAERGPGP